MTVKNVYSMKISSKEVDSHFITLKSKSCFFPPIENDFELLDGEISKEVKVKSYPCTCKGSERPHKHYFIRGEGLEVGNKV